MSSPDCHALSELIGQIYDAALRPELWPNVLGEIKRFAGGVAAGIYSKDSVHRAAEIAYEVGLDPAFGKSYVDTYVRLDPTTAAQVMFDVGKVISTTDVMQYDEFVETRFYKEWARPQKLVDFATVLIEKSSTRFSAFGVFRNEREGLVDDDMRQRLQLIAPHVQRAVLVGRAMDLKTFEAKIFADLVESLSVAICLVGEAGQIVHANRAARGMIEADGVVGSVGGRLIVRDGGANTALTDAISSASRGDGAVGTRGIALPITTKAGEHHIAHVLPLTSGRRSETGALLAAVAAVFVCKAEPSAPSAPELVAKIYKLTPTELRVLLGIVEIGGVPKVADALGIAETTVKTHLERLFDKIGVSRQADLVKVVASVSNPIL